VCVRERESARQRTRTRMRAFTNIRVNMLHAYSRVHVACTFTCIHVYMLQVHSHVYVACMHSCTCYTHTHTFAESNALLPAITSRGLMHLTNDGPCNAINVRGLGFCFGRQRHTWPSVAISFSSCALNCTVSDVLLACEEYKGFTVVILGVSWFQHQNIHFYNSKPMHLPARPPPHSPAQTI